MFTKYLEWKLLVQNNEEADLKAPVELEYYLIESSMDNREDLNGSKVYGVGITKRVDEKCLEEKIIYNYSCSVNKTKQLILVLANNTVTPVGLQPVLEDIL